MLIIWVYVSAQDNATIQYNNVSNVDLFEGMDQNLFSGGAISTTGANTIIQNNTVLTAGYSGIKFGGLNTKIQNNLVNGFCYIKEDGGGIDMSARDRAKGSVIDGNIVLNGIGSPNGLPNPNNLDFAGIFIDAYGTGITITNNTVANIATSGIKLHGVNNITVKNNTCYNNGGLVGLQVVYNCYPHRYIQFKTLHFKEISFLREHRSKFLCLLILQV